MGGGGGGGGGGSSKEFFGGPLPVQYIYFFGLQSYTPFFFENLLHAQFVIESVIKSSATLFY